MKITFVLPMFLDSPSGGFKVVYEYANRLQARGHRISVIHPRNIEPRYDFKDIMKSHLWKFKLRLRYHPLIPWMSMHPGINIVLASDLREECVPDGDVVFATAYQTAFSVNRYSERKGSKFYLIQSYESWSGPEERVRASWSLPLHKVVISRWLLNTAVSFGEAGRTDYIPIGLDFSHFKITTPIDQRQVPRVCMLAHPNEIKGTNDGLTALEIVRSEMPELQAVLFGTHPRSSWLPDWIEYEQLPSLERLLTIYNSCQAFLHPSWQEGWGLPAAEAMACGCALVSTANYGVMEFAADGETALFAPVKAPAELAKQLLLVLHDEELRHRIARNGSERIQYFTWDRAVESLEKLLIQKTSEKTAVSAYA